MNRLPFGEVFVDRTGGNVKLQTSDYRVSGRYPILDQGRREVAGYTDDPSAVASVDLPVIIFGDHTRALKYADRPFVLGADGTKILSPRRDADPRFLFHYLRSLDIPSAGYSRHYKFLKDITVPLPSVHMQRRIAAILDKADELRTKRRQALAHLDTLTQSIFHSMFGDPAQNNRGWPTTRLDRLGRIATGDTPSRSDASNFGNCVEWIKTDNINIPEVVLSLAAEGLSEKGAAKGRLAEAGSLLITCIAGSPGVIGNVAIADRIVAFNQQINAFTPANGPVLYWHGLLSGLKKSIQAVSTGGMKGLVSKSSLARVETIDTPWPLQEQFATRVAAVERLKENHRRHLAELDTLFASLQHRAFTGQL